MTAGLLLLAAAGSQALARTLWPADMLALGRNFVVLAAIAAFALSFAVRSWAATAVTGLALAANLYLLITPILALDRASPASATSAQLTVATYNVAWNDEAFESFGEWARKDGPEVIVLVELSDAWRTRIPELSDAYPYRASRLVEGDVRQDILSRSPIREAEVFRPSRGRTAVAAEIETLMGPVQVFAINPDKPQNPDDWRARNGYLALTSQWVSSRSRSSHAVAAGSWYVTPWSPFFTDVFETARMQTAQRNRWPLSTHGLAGPASGIVLGSPFDQVAVTPDIGSAGCALGPDFAGDYAPLICKLRLR